MSRKLHTTGRISVDDISIAVELQDGAGWVFMSPDRAESIARALLNKVSEFKTNEDWEAIGEASRHT